MGRAAQAVFASLVLGCGARTDLGKPAAVDASVTCESPVFPACDAGPAPFDACAPLHYSTSFAATCALARTACVPLDLVGETKPVCPFNGHPCVMPDTDDVAVFAANRYGLGHIVAICDVTGLNAFVPELRLVEYLGRSTSARVASLGTYPCQQGNIAGTFLGTTLPAKYVDAPDALAADFDVVVLCASPKNTTHTEYGPLEISWAPTFVSFVRDFGKGLLVAADYAQTCDSPADLFAPLNAITQGAGFEFARIELGGAPMTIDAACVPDWPD